MKENSIEEDIAKVNTYIELVLEKDYCNCNELNTILGKHCDGSKNVAYAMQHILSDYKRVLKENEKYKRLNEMNLKNAEEFKNNMCEHRCLLKSENEELQRENEELKEDRDKFKKALGKRITYCNELEKDLFENGSNYIISKQIVKDKIEELKKKVEELTDDKGYWGGSDLLEQIKVLQELLESEERK